jgi:hypothetical protein
MILALLGELPSGSVRRRLLNLATAAALAKSYFALCVGLAAEPMRQRSKLEGWWLAGFVRNLRGERPLTARITDTVRLFRRQAASNAMEILLVFISDKDQAQHWGWSL